MKNIKLRLCEIDHGRFEDIVHVMKIKEECGMCNYFNPHIDKPLQRYSCFVAPLCIAATLCSSLQKYLWYKLDEQLAKEHYNQSVHDDQKDGE